MKCTQTNCDKVYHILCLGINERDFESFSTDYLRQWICPECDSFKRKRVGNDTPVRTPEHRKLPVVATPNYVNNQRGSKSSQMELSVLDDDGGLLTEFKEFRREVRNRLDTQDQHILEIQKVCHATSDEIQKLRSIIQEKQRPYGDLTSIENYLKLLCDRNEHIKQSLSNAQISQSTSIKDKPKKLSSDDGALVTTPVIPTPNLESTQQNCAATKSASKRENHACQNIIVRSDSDSMVSGLNKPSENDNWVEVGKKATRNRSNNKSNGGQIKQPKNIEKPHSKSPEVKQTVASVAKDKNTDDGGIVTTAQLITKTVQRGQNANFTGIKALERKKHLHVWRLTLDTTIEKLESHVKLICGSDVTVKIEKVKRRIERDYSSFIITVSENMYDKLCRPEAWPVNTAYAEWIWFRRSTNKPIDEA